MNLTGKIGTMLALAMLCGAVSHAGVVIEEEESTSGSMMRPEASTRKQTVMLEGHKEKLVSQHDIIIDLDKGTMTMIDPANKTYTELPTGFGGVLARSFAPLNLEYKKTGNKKTIAGHNCVEYTGSGKNPNGEYSVTACYSKDAPGAGEYDKFQKAMVEKLGAAATGGSNPPEGVPLESKRTTKITGIAMPGMSPEQAKAMSQALANRPPVTSTITVTSIKEEKLPADTFAIPQGYTKREMAHGPPGGLPMGHPSIPPAGAAPPAAPPPGNS